MSQNENQVDVSIKLGADISGGIQSRAELDRVRAAAKNANKETANSAGNAADRMKGLARSVGLVRNALTGFGVVGIFTGLLSAIEKVSASFKDSKKEAEEFRKAVEEKDLAKSISQIADSYEKVKAAISSAAEAEKNALEIIDMEVKARRDLQEAKLAAAEEEELAGVDSNAEDAEEQKRVIREKYAHFRSTNTASDRLEDLVLQRQNLEHQADQADKDATVRKDQAGVLERKAQELRVLALAESDEATSLNDKDRTGFLSKASGGIKDVFTLNWGNLGNEKSEEGDAERAKHSAKAEEYIKQAEEMEKQAEALKKEADAKKTEAEQNRRRMTAMSGSIEAAQIAQGTAQVKSETAERDAADALQKKRDEKAKEKAKLDDAKTAAVLLQDEKDRIKAQIAAAQANKDRANLIAFNAESDYETAKLGGSRREQTSKGNVLQNAQRYAQDVSHEADKTIAALTETLKSVEARLKAAQSAIQNASKQQTYAWSESPSGS